MDDLKGLRKNPARIKAPLWRAVLTCQMDFQLLYVKDFLCPDFLHSGLLHSLAAPE